LYLVQEIFWQRGTYSKGEDCMGRLRTTDRPPITPPLQGNNQRYHRQSREEVVSGRSLNQRGETPEREVLTWRGSSL
jgi:hypothetical protein